MKLLIDTSAVLALVLKQDENHRRAAEFARRSPEHRYVLSELVLSEVVTRIRARAGATQAVAIGTSLLESRRYEVVFVDADMVGFALARIARYDDKRLSLADAASFELMERLGIEAAFTFDRDFRDCGFRMLP